MCMLCVEIQKKTMTTREVARAFREFAVPEGHMTQLMDEIEDNYGIESVAKELNELYREEEKQFLGEK